MTIRSRRETVTFKHPFHLRGVARQFPAGAYEVVTDEEMIEGLSFPVWHRVATMITVPADSVRGATERLSIGSVDLADAQRIDASAPDAGPSEPGSSTPDSSNSRSSNSGSSNSPSSKAGS
ncbi:hypothetical protein [Bradyrhizobium cajani]|uniref:hypothetical protein n=1 Tax=Bradyrhizobium cajani TaxID=1928661 RepID=UPI001FE46053|nr:hypothetical protein [Bradyrhizobium cajani]MCP3370187.1 hypothetical protein [Bradyrhizobium cajani]